MKRRGPVAAVLAALLATTGCGGGDERDATVPGTVTIGLLVSLSGTHQAVGTDMRDGFKLYLDTHGGRLGGHDVDLVIADEGDGPSSAVPAATKLITQDKAIAVSGIVTGGTVAAVAPLLAEAGIPLVASNGRPPLTDVTSVWHTSFLPEDPGVAIAQHVRATVNGPVYVIGPDHQGGWDEPRAFTETFTRAGGQLANPGGRGTLTPYPATANFAPYLAQVKASGAKAVYTSYAGKAAVDFVKQYAQSDVAGVPLYAAGFLTEGPVLVGQGDAARDIFNVLNYSPDLDNAANRAFVTAWKSAHPDATPTTYAVASYDAAAVLDRAIAAAGKNPTPESVNAAIARLGQIDSPRGQWQFGAKTHAPVQRWYLRQVRQDGRALANVMVSELATVGS